MAFLKLLWRGMRDLYDSFAYFITVSLAFWLCCAPVLLGIGFLAMPVIYWTLFLLSTVLVPPALTTLFALSDPRAAIDRMEWRNVPRVMGSVFVRSWKVALIALGPLVMIGWNITYFAGSGHAMEFLIPLWIVMWILLLVLSMYCFSLAGTHDSGPRNAFRGGMYILVKYPFRSIGLALFVLLLGYMATAAILPMVIIGPPFFAAIVNRFVFDALEVHVIDPNAPTDERSLERERGINMDRGLIDRVLRRGKE